MCEIMNEVKKGELDRVTFKTDSLRKYFPKSYTSKQMEDKIIQLLEQWQKKREKSMEYQRQQPILRHELSEAGERPCYCG